jgi:hypothetical protein
MENAERLEDAEAARFNRPLSFVLRVLRALRDLRDKADRSARENRHMGAWTVHPQMQSPRACRHDPLTIRNNQRNSSFTAR